MISMRDVAERAGVSRATVSVVLSGRSGAVGINEETRLRVLASAEELGYKRNALLRGAVSGRSRMLGFVVWRPEYEAEARMLAGALDEAEKHDYTIKVLRARDSEMDRAAIERCLELRVSGVLAVKMQPRALGSLNEEMSRREVPVTTLGSSIAQKWCAHVGADDAGGCRLLIEHLRALGHERIAFIGGHAEDDDARSRLSAFKSAIKEAGLALPRSYLEEGRWTVDVTTRATQKLLGGRRPPTAIVCASDEMALIACRTARAMGRVLPRDLSITGFSDLDLAKLCDPALTTVALPFEEIGAQAVAHTLERTGPGSFHDTPEHLLLPTRLVVRSSTAPPKT